MQPIRPNTVTAGLGLGALTLGLASMLVNGPSAAAQVEPTPLSPDPTIIEFFRRNPEDRNRGRDGTSRGDDWVETADGSASEPTRTCILNPGRNDTLWHLQPLFLIQGQVSRMEVKEFQPFLRRRIDPPPFVLWSVAPNAVGVASPKMLPNGKPIANSGKPTCKASAPKNGQLF